MSKFSLISLTEDYGQTTESFYSTIFQELASGSFGSSHFFKKFVGGKIFEAPMFQFEPESTKDWKNEFLIPDRRKTLEQGKRGKHKF